MTLTDKRPELVATPRSELGFAYLMSGIALGCIVISWIFGSIFAPHLVTTGGSADTGYTHQHIPLVAFSVWIWYMIAIAMVLPAAMKGIRAKVTDRAGWTLLGLGIGGIWLAVMFISIFVPVTVVGTAPWLTWFPFAAMFAPLGGVIVTGLLCKSVKAAFFEPALSRSPSEHALPTAPTAGHELAGDDPAAKLRQLAQLRDAGIIKEADFEAKKNELLSRM
jgi:putative oligomerization/nucleic acid binding protein